jgi:hypothetical protein
MCQVFVQCYSILGTKIFDKPPRFFKGHGILLGLLTVAAVAIVLKWWIMCQANAEKVELRREAGARGEAVSGLEMEYSEKHPTFRYLL